MNFIYTIMLTLFITSFTVGQTSEQIKQAKEIIKKTGMTESDVRREAKARGIPDAKVNNIINKEKNSQIEQRIVEDNLTNKNHAIERAGEMKKDLVDYPVEIIDQSTNQESAKKNELKLDSKEIERRDKLKYFGYEIFKQDPSLFQATSVGAIDPGYSIGPGDEIIVMLWGETQFRQVLKVDREGFIFITDIGQVFVNGLNLSMLESKLFKILSQSFSSLAPIGREATTFLDISIGNLRPLRIQVLGEVGQPGVYTVSPNSTIFSSLYYFNGPTTLGTLRDIKLIRNNTEVTDIDFYDYLLTGKKPKDEKLQLDDIIFIPKRLKTISIRGEVKRPGIYELKDNESLADLIEMSGGLKTSAYLNRAQIDRITPFFDRDRNPVDRFQKDVNLKKVFEKNFKETLFDGDKITVFSIFNEKLNYVSIKGAIGRPGDYELSDSLRLKDLIFRADSLLGDAHPERVDIVRTREDLTQEIVELNLEKVINGDKKHNILLKSLDMVRVYSENKMRPTKTVQILGHVKYPGKYTLFENMTLHDLIFKAGGYLDTTYKNETFLERADLIRYENDQINKRTIKFNLGHLLSDPYNSKENYILNDNDLVRVYSKKIFGKIKPVAVEGSINFPGIYDFKIGMTLMDLLMEAGGFSENILSYKIEISRVNNPIISNDIYSRSISCEITNEFKIFNYNGKSDEIKDDNLFLEPFDKIYVRSNPYYTSQKKVFIQGEVLFPGEYALLHHEETLFDLIKRAGGMKQNNFAVGSTFFRDGKSVQIDISKLMRNPTSKNNIVLKEGDKINIASRPGIINIIGEVNAPGFYKFNKGSRINDIIRESGGLSQNADKGHIFIIYPNGKSKKYRRLFSNPRVTEGSIIQVLRKKEEKPFDQTEYLKEITSIFANLAQVISLILIAKS